MGKFVVFPYITYVRHVVRTMTETHTNNVEILASAHFVLGKRRACASLHWNITIGELNIYLNKIMKI